MHLSHLSRVGFRKRTTFGPFSFKDWNSTLQSAPEAKPTTSISDDQEHELLTITYTREMTNPEKIGAWRAFCTQSNLSNRLTKETWYGYHSPCRRIFLFFLLSSWISAFGALVQLTFFYNIPLMKVMSTVELDEIRRAQYEGHQAVCRAMKQVGEIDCIVNSDASEARVDYESYSGPPTVPIPKELRDAFEKSFGPIGRGDIHIPSNETTQEGASSTKPDDLLFEIVSALNGQVPPSNKFVWMRVLPDCTAEFGATPDSGLAPKLPLIYNWKPNVRSTIAPKWSFFCYDPADGLVSEDTIVALEKAIGWLFTHRHAVFFWGVFAFGMIFGLLFLTPATGMSVFLTTLLVRWLLPWPQDGIGDNKITFWRTWRTLLLIGIVTSQRYGDLGDAILAGTLYSCAHYFGDAEAARAWVDLGVAWFGLPYLFPLLDKAMDAIAMIDFLNIARVAGWGFGLFLHGQGWWKLVFLYAILRAHPSWKALKQRYLGVGTPELPDEGVEAVEEVHTKLD